MTAKILQFPRSAIVNNRLLLVAGSDLAPLLKTPLESEGFLVDIVECYGRLDDVYTELSRIKHDAVLLTNNSLKPQHILELVSSIRKTFPNILILVLSGIYDSGLLTSLRSTALMSLSQCRAIQGTWLDA